MFDNWLKDAQNDMMKSVDSFLESLRGISTGKAHPDILNPVIVDAHGSRMRLTQVANVNVVNSKMLSVNIWDDTLVGEVNNAILRSNLGLTPIVEGKVIRVPIPNSTEERRKELIKAIKMYSENAKQFLRNIRRKYLKECETNKDDFSKDDLKRFKNKIQDLLNSMENKVDDTLKNKEKEILEV